MSALEAILSQDLIAHGGCPAVPCSAWYVCHPDAQDLGLIAPRFATESEAIAKRDEWNSEIPGHYVIGLK